MCFKIALTYYKDFISWNLNYCVLEMEILLFHHPKSSSHVWNLYRFYIIEGRRRKREVGRKKRKHLKKIFVNKKKAKCFQEYSMCKTHYVKVY